MKKLKILILIILILILLILSALVLIHNNSYQDQQEKSGQGESKDIEFQEVTNPHMYLTVKSCIDKYINYMYQGDNESVYRIIDNSYIEKFNISKENIFQIIGDIKTPVTLSIKKMYVYKINESEEEYYVSASLVEESIEGVKIKETEFIVTVKLDINNMIYSVVPNGYGGPLYEKK